MKNTFLSQGERAEAAHKKLDRPAEWAYILKQCNRKLGMTMPFKQKIGKSTSAILLVGLLAFLICQPHSAIGDEHDSAVGTDESCQVLTIPSTVISGLLLSAPSQIPGHADSLFILTSALDFGGVGSSWMIGNTVPPASSHCSVKLYKFICTYRL